MSKTQQIHKFVYNKIIECKKKIMKTRIWQKKY